MSKVFCLPREYFSTGFVLVWVADPSDHSVSVYRSPTDVEILTGEETLTGENVLPGFKASIVTLLPTNPGGSHP